MWRNADYFFLVLDCIQFFVLTYLCIQQERTTGAMTTVKTLLEGMTPASHAIYRRRYMKANKGLSALKGGYVEPNNPTNTVNL